MRALVRSTLLFVLFKLRCALCPLAQRTVFFLQQALRFLPAFALLFFAWCFRSPLVLFLALRWHAIVQLVKCPADSASKNPIAAPIPFFQTVQSWISCSGFSRHFFVCLGAHNFGSSLMASSSRHNDVMFSLGCCYVAQSQFLETISFLFHFPYL